MKMLMSIIVAFVVGMGCFASPSDELIDALVQVESNGKANAIGDNGKAVGVLQIWTIVVDDVNRFSTTKYTYADRYNSAKSREICRKYLIHYGGKNATNETYARIWNGGPKGHKKSSTKGYWKKVQARMG